MRRLAQGSCAVLDRVSCPNAIDWAFSFPVALDRRYTPGVYSYGPPGRRQQGDIVCNCVTCSIRIVGRAAHGLVDGLRRFSLFPRAQRIDKAKRQLERLTATMALEIQDLDITPASFTFTIPESIWIDGRGGNHPVGERRAKSAVDAEGRPGIRVGLGFIAV